MGFHWHEEIPPRWDHAKARIIGGAPPGVFDFGHQTAGDLLAGQWWRAEADDRRVVGYGWMDCNWGDGEILIAVDPEWQARGAGTFILERLRAEAARLGVNYVYNIVPDRHPDGDRVEAWLKHHGFERHGEGRLLRARAALAALVIASWLAATGQAHARAAAASAVADVSGPGWSSEGRAL